MIVKSRTTDLHLADLTEMFQVLKRYNMCLNPCKCAFEIRSRKFLDFIIHKMGIYINLEKVYAILKMHSPRSINEAQ